MTYETVRVPQPSKTSTRRYERLQFEATMVTPRGGVPRTPVTLYVDEGTGIVTTDVGAFEEWIKGMANEG